MPPWIQVVELQWRPELRFFENRSQLLRELEGLGLVEEFHWTVDDVTVRMHEFQAVTIGIAGATIYLASPRVSTDKPKKALHQALLNLNPDSVTFASARIRYALPVDLEPSDAQARSASRLIGDTFTTATATDYALLLDGYCERLSVQFQLEFGLVNPEELLFRLSPGATRIGPHASVLSPDLNDPPACAMFLDWSMAIQRAMGDDPFHNVVSTWNDLIEETQRLSGEVLASHALSPINHLEESG